MTKYLIKSTTPYPNSFWHKKERYVFNAFESKWLPFNLAENFNPFLQCLKVDNGITELEVEFPKDLLTEPNNELFTIVNEDDTPKPELIGEPNNELFTIVTEDDAPKPELIGEPEIIETIKKEIEIPIAKPVKKKSTKKSTKKKKD